MKSYYEIEGTFRYYNPQAKNRGTEPAHQYFANLNLTPKALIMFSRRFGSLFWGPDVALPEPTVINPVQQAPEEDQSDMAPPFVSDDRFWERYYLAAKQAQEALQGAWSHDMEALGNILPSEIWTQSLPAQHEVGSVSGPPYAAFMQIGAHGIEVRMADLWSYIRFAFAYDLAREKAKLCANRDCPTPYFIELRRGQLFCSHKCAVLINVRRFRERARAQSRKKKFRSIKPKKR